MPLGKKHREWQEVNFFERLRCPRPWLTKLTLHILSFNRKMLPLQVYFIEDVLPDYQWDVHAICNAWQNAIRRSK